MRAKGGGADIRRGGGLEVGIAMLFSHHIYCAQSKVKWGGGGGAHGMNGGGGHARHSYATVPRSLWPRSAWCAVCPRSTSFVI